MRKRTLLPLLLLAAALGAAGAELGVSPSCVVRAEEIEFKLHCAAPKWKGGTTQDASNVTFPGEAAAGGTFRRGTFAVRNYGAFDFSENRRVENGRAEVSLALSSRSGIETELLAVVAELPPCVKPYIVNGKERSFPAVYRDRGWQIKVPHGENRLAIPLRRGVLHIRGEFEAMLQDNRRFSRGNVALRLMFSPSAGRITEAELAFDMEYVPYESVPVTLGASGGSEVRTLGGIRFDVPRGGAFPRGERRFRIPEKDASFRWLYCLSALDGVPEREPAGTLRITYADGGSREFELAEHRETALQTRPGRLENAACVWEEEGKALFAAAFELAGKPVAEIAFSGDPRLSLAGLSLSGERIVPPEEKKEWAPAAGEEWSAFSFRRDIVPGSALDFSFLLDAPAGKYGFLKTAGSRFEFEKRPGRRVRFWGTNLTGAALFAGNAELDRMADRLAANGYNLVRFHHFDQPLTAAGADSTVPDPEKMDRLNYLFAACKKRGMYVTIDLYMSRVLRRGEIPAYPDRALSGREFKALAMIDSDVAANLERYSRNLLTRINPYTGLAWKDDPALASVSIINEGTLATNIRAGFVREACEKEFRRYAAARKTEITPENRSRLHAEFLHGVYRNGYARFSEFLRSLGVRVPLTDLNYTRDVSVAIDRRALDYVDIHSYWAHPDSVTMPRTANPESSLGSFGGFAELFAVRHLDRPFAVTEWSNVFPNGYRSEGGILAGAAAAFQDYDLLCRFNYVSNPERALKPAPVVGFEQANDPVSLLSDRAGALLFLRGDVSPAENVLAFPVGAETEFGGNAIPGEFRFLGWLAKTGLSFDGAAGAAGSDFLKQFRNDPGQGSYDGKRGIVVSSTGELRLDALRNTFLAVSPCSEAFIGPAGSRLEGAFASVKIDGAFASVAAASLDGEPLGDSGRILLLHLTDCQNSRMRYTDRSRGTLEVVGGLPLLLRRGRVHVALGLPGARKYRLFTLDSDGRRSGELPFEVKNGKLEFTMDNRDGAFAYELTAAEQ